MDNNKANFLKNLKVIELEGYLPIAVVGKCFEDSGADVELIVSTEKNKIKKGTHDVNKYKKQVEINLKTQKESFVRKIKDADILLESFKPGTLERLGLSPDFLHSINSKLIIVRLSGYGNEGKLRDSPGHEINYMSYGGLSIKYNAKDRLIPPFITLGDVFTGSMLCFYQITQAIIKRHYTGKGCVMYTSLGLNAHKTALLLTSLSEKNQSICYTIGIKGNISLFNEVNNIEIEENLFLISFQNNNLIQDINNLLNVELKPNIINYISKNKLFELIETTKEMNISLIPISDVHKAFKYLDYQSDVNENMTSFNIFKPKF